MKTTTRGRWASLRAALLVTAALAACLPIDETEFHTLDVRVTDEFGVPLAGARVEPKGGWYWEPPRAIGYTDVDGRARFTLPPSFYYVDVYAPNVGKWTPPFLNDTIRLETQSGSLDFEFAHFPEPDSTGAAGTE